jgi:hypothetical protein
MKISTTIAKFENKLDTMLAIFYQHILDLPQNKLIKPISSNCFIVKLGCLKQNWSVEYHDFKWQYHAIVSLLRKDNKLKVINNLNQILEQQTLKIQGTRYRLHPQVINNIKRLLK